MNRVCYGIDQLLTAPDAVRGRLGLVTNDSARLAADSALRGRVALQQAGFELVRLFSPEHGLAISAPDGAAVADGLDPLTRIPVVSLYGERMRPTRESLADLDGVLFDIPDIGARFYTYIWTLSHLLEACAEAGVPLVILDRPNPLGGDLAAAEGPLLDTEKFSSFIGRAAIPIRHSLTVGELAALWNVERNLNAKLQVIRGAGWRRSLHWPETGLPFVQTSPAIASYEAALIYPGLGLFEATGLSVGRGTSLAFQAVGAPWLRAEETARRFNALLLPGVAAQPEIFTPASTPFAGEQCEAVRLLVTDAKRFRPVRAGLHLLATVMASHREDFRWANYPTAANPTGEGHFERLIGQADIREALEANPDDLSERIQAWTAVPGWAESVKDVLFYA